MNNAFISPRLCALAVAATLTGCGGSGGSGDNSSPAATTGEITAIGMITGFGSIYVNGIRFNTSGANYEVDDSIASGDDALATGMIVKVEGTLNADGNSGSANHVYYDDDVEGVVENLARDGADPDIKTFDVMGIDVRAERGKTSFDSEGGSSFDFDTLENGNHVEVSGYFSANVLNAT